jgi:hypothetical protein
MRLDMHGNKKQSEKQHSLDRTNKMMRRQGNKAETHCHAESSIIVND